MVEFLKDLDTRIFLFVNHLNNSFFDFLFFWISNKWIWIPFYSFLAWVVFQFDRKNFLLILFFIALAITASDQLASSVIKVAVMRLRPCHEPAIADQVHLVNNYCGGRFGFVSSHAANVFTLAAFISALFKRKHTTLLKLIWIWAVIVSLSRVYLGVHYPGDVIGGALLGIVTGYTLHYLYSVIIKSKTQS